MQFFETCYTFFLFIRSDIKTTLIPALFWLLIHLLQFNFSNQLVSIDEDKQNKAYRPLPSCRISVDVVRDLRLYSKALCLGVSLHFGSIVFGASLASLLLTLICNEANGAQLGVAKNLLTAGGISMFMLGTLSVLGQDQPLQDNGALHTVIVNSMVMATTVHAQDFRDVHGDVKAGRNTFPISMPKISRYSMPISLSLWAWFFNANWHFGPGIASTFFMFSVYVGMRYIWLTSVDDDILSYRWYNVWMSVCFCIPGMHYHATHWIETAAVIDL
ncbi:hypothetical protein BDP27DRAFT_505700 [Rhodocollybia butyracea]|uniref:Uncharacterized protein n=1 Tax=Rhodocollybia butyracea TaxID=206335 RepID=A0A9P5P6Y5_9AGAR|nr:hypothetical protein BDP27DRAFT_505700 [Rhodocollybia butyracea]